MAPYNFDDPDTDAILRSSDGKELHVHRIILSLASPVFHGLFSLPQPTEPRSRIPTIDVSESSHILQPFLQYLYPRSPPKITDLPMWEALYTIADKYSVDVVMDPLRDMLMHRFLKKSPLRVYALASHWGFEEIAKVASTRTLKMDIFKHFPKEDAELMGGSACQRLYNFHCNHQEAARDVVTNHPVPRSGPFCRCRSPDFGNLIPALCKIVATRPWLPSEEVYEEAAGWTYPTACSEHCRNAFNNLVEYFASILKGLSKLPQTI